MTLLVALTLPDRVIVGADTAVGGEGPDGDDPGNRTVSKIFALPHVPALVTMRGPYVAHGALFSAMAYLGGTLDEVLSVLPETMAKVHEAAPPEQMQHPQMGYIFGWHEARGAFTSWQLDGMEPDADFSLSEADALIAAPWDDCFPALSAPTGEDAMLDMMRIQRQQIRERHPSVATGNLVTLAHMTRDRVIMWKREL